MVLLSQALRLGGLLPPHSAFQGHATHLMRWPMRLSPNGSRGTCIPQGLATFLQPLARRTNGVPQPTRMRFFEYITPHFVELGAEPTTHLKLIRTPDFYFHVLGIQGRQHTMIHRLQLRLFFFSSLMTVVGLTCKTRAVSRIPLAFMAMSTICCFTSGDWPA